jgi:hypothetical protein
MEDVNRTSMVRLVPCGHPEFCDTCIDRMRMSGDTRCPVCRTRIEGYNTDRGSVDVRMEQLVDGNGNANRYPASSMEVVVDRNFRGSRYPDMDVVVDRSGRKPVGDNGPLTLWY